MRNFVYLRAYQSRLGKHGEGALKPIYRLIGGLVALSVVVFLFGNQAVGYVQAGYPKDMIKREALARCAAADPHFLRFSQKDRTECYMTAHLPHAIASSER